jgi:exopolysaccharide biosynthesis protein
VIDNLDCSDKSLTTSFGETIRALNVPENVIVVQVTGDNFVGALACVKDPTQLSLTKAKAYGSYGELIEDYCADNVLAINASGFRDAEGVGNGGTIVGSYVLDGKEYGSPVNNYLFFGFKQDDRLYISWGIKDKEEYKWAMQFSPALIVNGKSEVEGSYGWGMQPRSAIGQTKNGEVLLLIVDGRQVGYSIGCTVSDCADIMMRHKAYQAVNLDGGSSSIMAYEGKIITKNSSASSNGRTLPNAFVVGHAKN